MKQRNIQSFLMVSAAFFAISAPMSGARANSSKYGASPIQQVAQARVQSVRAGSDKRRASDRAERSDDTAA